MFSENNADDKTMIIFNNFRYIGGNVPQWPWNKEK